MFTHSGVKEKKNYSDFSTWYQCTTIFQLSVLTIWTKFFVKNEQRFTILNVFCFFKLTISKYVYYKTTNSVCPCFLYKH